VYQVFFPSAILEGMVKVDAIRHGFECLWPTLDERMRRLVAAAQSLAIGYGGISRVARATGISRRAIARGIAELGQRHPYGVGVERSANPAAGASAPSNRMPPW
jgi:hypothetical protein